MSKINFNLLSLFNYNEFNEEQAVGLSNLIEEIKARDELCIPEEFYTKLDENGENFLDYMKLYGSSVKQLLCEIVFKNKASIYKSYDEIFEKVEVKEIALVGVKDNYDKEYECRYTVCSLGEIPKIKRAYLTRYHSYEEFINRAEACYPDLVFHEDCFEHIKLLGDYEQNIQELDKNLSALNDFGAQIYESVNKNEEAAIKTLESKCSVICSGKGSNENKSYKINYIQKTKIERKPKKPIELTCNPHLKLFRKNTDKRIYFCWGRDEIEKHKIIIARIGNHWR